MNLRTRILSIVFVSVLVQLPGIVRAQLVTETIPLQTGWNAVWVNLEPEPNDLPLVLGQQAAPSQFQAIWTFERDGSGAASESGGASGRWFFFDKDVPPELTTLRTLHGHRAYYIKMNAPEQLSLSGRPLIRSTQFTSRSSNLFGALVGPPSGAISFENFFSHPNAKGKIRASGTPLKHDIFALIGDVLVRKTISDFVAPNTAYWLNVVQDFEYAGPLDATSNLNGLSFGRNTAQRTLSLEVPASSSARTVSLVARACAVLSPTGDCVPSGESVDWLEYRDPAQPGAQIWQPLSAGLTAIVPAGATHVDVELRARRSGLSALSRNRAVSATSDTFPAVIDISDQQGFRAALATDVTIEPIFGHWIGRATLTQVSTHPLLQTLPLNQAAASPMSMTLLLDLPDPSTNAAGFEPRLLDSLSIQSFRDGRSVLRRFSSVLFDRPVDLVEDSADPIDPFGETGTLRGTLHIAPDDALNPYRHRYNPEHRRGYDITREITIKIENPEDSLSDELAGLDGTFGPHRLTGLYTEVITGVTVDAITVQGTFRLERLDGENASQ